MMKPPSPENSVIYLLDLGGGSKENPELSWCNDPAPGAGMDEDDAIGPYYHATAIKDLPEDKLAELGVMRIPEKMSDNEVWDACMGFRHDYGLMEPEESERMRYHCRMWFKYIIRAITRPCPIQ